MNSDFLKLNLTDVQKAFIVAILSGPIGIVYSSVTAVPMVFKFDWKILVGSALAGGLGYIIKNFLTGSGGKLLTNDPKP